MTYDPISLKRIASLHPKIRYEVDALFKFICEVKKVPIRITQTLRTIEEQDFLYAQGRTRPGPIVTWARGGFGYHNYGLAADFCLLIDGKMWDLKYDDPNDEDRTPEWMEVVEVFESHGYEAGIRWPGKKIDPPHLQKTFGLSITDLRGKYQKGQMKDGYVIIL